MLKKFFTKPIEITVGEQIFRFNSLPDFEFSLVGRTSVPSKKITGMVKFSPDELKKEARTIKDIEKRFVTILSKSISDPDSIDQALREIDPQIFSQDHGWRMIIAGLHDGDEELNEFRRVALVKYMQYLSSRQEIIKYLYSEKKKSVKSSDSLNTMEASGKFEDTLTLEKTVFEPLASDNQNLEMEKMPKGESVTIRIKAGVEVNILLSKHKCKLISEQTGIYFIDGKSRNYQLKSGKNTIGRDSKSDIMLDPDFRDVSRIHIIIEVDNANTVYMTDISAHGTYLPAKYLKNHTF